MKAPRAHVEFEVWTMGAKKMIELPFVMGVMADLAGKSKKALDPLSKRDFLQIDDSGLAPLFNKYRPRVAFAVPNKISPEGGNMMVDLEFESMDDFSPDRVAAKVEPLRKLLEQRIALKELLANLDGQENAEKKLNEYLEKVRALGQEKAQP